MTAMEPAMLRRAYAAECLGTALLLATVVGSGIMAEKLAGGNVAIALLGNTIPTGAILVVLITILGPISGAHFNPAVSLSMCVTARMPWKRLAPFIVCQIVLPFLQVSTKMRWGAAQWFAEFVATFGLLLTIFGGLRFNQAAIPVLVGLYITAAYWFTASTSFANPAVTIARALSDTFAGIAPTGVAAFIAAQLAGAVAATLLSRWLWAEHRA
jgi:glycerol uptake facilitator-like aquaporin